MRKLLFGTAIAALFAIGSYQELQAIPDEDCGTMHNWTEVKDFWFDDEWHSSASSVMSGPGDWRYEGAVRNVEYLHSEFAEGFVDSIHHPSCGTNG
jgi:hypothetical protein